MLKMLNKQSDLGLVSLEEQIKYVFSRNDN